MVTYLMCPLQVAPLRVSPLFFSDMPSKNPRIRVTPEVLQRLKEIQREGESDSDTVQRLLDAEGSEHGA